jgi:hypothetical protein
VELQRAASVGRRVRRRLMRSSTVEKHCSTGGSLARPCASESSTRCGTISRRDQESALIAPRRCPPRRTCMQPLATVASSSAIHTPTIASSGVTEK